MIIKRTQKKTVRCSADYAPASCTHTQVCQELIRRLQTAPEPARDLKIIQKRLPEIQTAIQSGNVVIKKACQQRQIAAPSQIKRHSNHTQQTSKQQKTYSTRWQTKSQDNKA